MWDERTQAMRKERTQSMWNRPYGETRTNLSQNHIRKGQSECHRWVPCFLSCSSSLVCCGFYVHFCFVQPINDINEQRKRCDLYNWLKPKYSTCSHHTSNSQYIECQNTVSMTKVKLISVCCCCIFWRKIWGILYLLEGSSILWPWKLLLLTGTWVIIKVSGQQYRWWAGG